MPTYERLGTENREELQDRWKPAIYLDKEPSIMVRQPDATMQPTPQDNQLISKHRVLGFKPQLRLEWQGHDSQKETEQSDHSASLGNSITSSTRTRFSVHTGETLGKKTRLICNPPLCCGVSSHALTGSFRARNSKAGE